MWVREMLVSIVTVLSRLPSLAATTEAKFSAPAESKAMVNLPVLIHLLACFFFFFLPLHQSIPDILVSAVVMCSQPQRWMWFQAVHFDPVCYCFSFLFKFSLEISTQYLRFNLSTPPLHHIFPYFLNVPYQFKARIQ